MRTLKLPCLKYMRLKKIIIITQVWHLLNPSERMHSYELEELLWGLGPTTPSKIKCQHKPEYTVLK